MNLPKFPCKNHPQIYSARKCYYCQQPICQECQLVLWHHIFCGRWCAFKHGWSALSGQLKRRREYLYILAIVLILQFIMYVMIRQMINQQAAGTREERSLETGPLSPFRIDTAFVPQSNLLQISGEAPVNTILGLWHNGQFVASTISYTRHYSFKAQYLYAGINKFVIWAFSDQGRLYKIDSLSLQYFSAYTAMLAVPVNKFQTDQNYLALTFDAGSTAQGADTILQILDNKSIAGTIFLTGDFIKSYPAIIKKLVAQGLELGNHTYNHPHLTNWERDREQTTAAKVDRYFIYQQLQRTDSIFFRLMNRHLKPYWRAPYGELNTTILQWAAEIGYRHIGWTKGCDSRDWVADPESELYRSADQFYQHFMQLEQAGQLKGAILLMHLGTDRKSDFIYPALVRLIDQLLAKNYQFLTISQFLQVSKPL
jgi:peptidoglycan/xylan/chitin deacetylase (PgdA/CDA1 family)